MLQYDTGITSMSPPLLRLSALRPLYCLLAQLITQLRPLIQAQASLGRFTLNHSCLRLTKVAPNLRIYGLRHNTQNTGNQNAIR